MATDKVKFPHLFFVPESGPKHDAWQPRADIYRLDDGWLIKLELAGVRADEIRLVARNSMLVVRGTRRDHHCYQSMGCHCMEISYSQFERAIELPGLPESVEILTSYVDGMLLVRIKTEAGT